MNNALNGTVFTETIKLMINHYARRKQLVTKFYRDIFYFMIIFQLFPLFFYILN